MEVSREEFERLYGDVEVEFSHYYKYSFTFCGRTDEGDRLSLLVGGCADDIYRLDVEADRKVKVKDLYGSYGCVSDPDDYTKIKTTFNEGY